jgi:plastocyanin
MNVSSFKKILSAALATTFSFCFLAAIPVLANNTNTVVVGNNGAPVFSPVTNNINVNDAIIWVWGPSAPPGHSTTSDTNGIWDSSVFVAPHSFTNSFPTPGTFPFHCTIHAAVGMKGVVIVSGGANVPPTVTITNPVAGTVLSAPASVTIRASATDSDGTVANVQFLAGTTVLTNCPTAPFFGVANNLAAGSYTLAAIATDNLGATGTNTVTINVVTPVTVALGQPQQSAGTNFQFSYSANVGLSYVVVRATNLASPNWIPLLTNKATTTPVTFVETNAVANPAFYRVGLQPNP